MAKSTCTEAGCGRDVAGRGLCMMHYQRMRAGRPLQLELPTRACESCLAEFKPKTIQQKHCTRQCGANFASRRARGYLEPVPKTRICEVCDVQFTRTGRSAQKYCSLKCGQAARSWARDYGLTVAQYRAMFEAQGGLCACCKRPGVEGRKTVLCVDHCHETSQVRGLLCGNCNAAIGLLGDTLEGVLAAVDYLRSTS